MKVLRWKWPLLSLVVAIASASPTWATLALVDNFDSYDNSTGVTIGASSGTNRTGNRWIGVFDGTGAAEIVDVAGTNQAALIYGASGSGGWRGIEANLTSAFGGNFSLPHGSTGTYFFRFNPTSTVRNAGSDGADWDVMMGLSDNVGAIDNNNAWQDFAVMPFFAGAGDGTADFRVLGPSGNVDLISNAALDTWYNVWLVVDNASKNYDVYTSIGTADGILGVADAPYRNGLGTGALEAISFMSHSDNAMLFDDIYFTLGVDTSIPPAVVPEPSAFLFGGLVCAVLGVNYTRKKLTATTNS